MASVNEKKNDEEDSDLSIYVIHFFRFFPLQPFLNLFITSLHLVLCCKEESICYPIPNIACPPLTFVAIRINESC